MNSSLYGYALQGLQSLSAASQAVGDHRFRGARGGERLLRLGADFARAIEGTPAETSVIERADLLPDETGPGSRFRKLFDFAAMYVSLLSEAVRRSTASRDTPPAGGLLGDEWVTVIHRIGNHLMSTDATAGETSGGATEPPSALTARFFRLCGWEGVRDNSPVNLPAIIAVLEVVTAYLPPDEDTSGEAVCETTLWQWAERGRHRSVFRFVIHELEGYRQRFDERHLRGSELLRRCRPELFVGPEDCDHLKSALWEDTPDKARILAAAAESALAAIPASGSVDTSDQDPDPALFYLEPLRGDKKQIMAALFAADLGTTADPKHLDCLVDSGDIAIRGGGKTWRVFVRSKPQYEKARRELDKIKPARKSRR